MLERLKGNGAAQFELSTVRAIGQYFCRKLKQSELKIRSK